MPMFMDSHDNSSLPDEVVEDLRNSARAGKTDEFGVRQADLFYNSNGKVYCLLEAPDEDAVRRHHAALEVPCGPVHEVNRLL